MRIKQTGSKESTIVPGAIMYQYQGKLYAAATAQLIGMPTHMATVDRAMETLVKTFT